MRVETSRKEGRGSCECLSHLKGPPDIDETVIVIQPPHAMGASWLKIINILQLSHGAEIAHKDSQHKSRQIFSCDNLELEETEEEEGEVRLVTGAIVDAPLITKRVREIC
jgi:hypothetical protein